MEPKFQVQLKIRKPVAEVFAAVVEPQKLTGYFIQTSSGPLTEGATVTWMFAEAPEPCEVTVRKLAKNETIVLEWAGGRSYNTRVEMEFKPLDAMSTLVLIRESGWRSDDTSTELSYGNAGGWMHMLCCLKAFLEYNINLRAGGVR
jgi:uncharacterized protein YndB with AHSA1/START domain